MNDAPRPTIGITMDIDGDRYKVGRACAARVVAAGGSPVHLSPQPESLDWCTRHCDGFIFTGGDDPIMEKWGIATHAHATPVHPDRQQFELALLDRLAERDDVAVLGICLGMQFMALHAGGALDQYLPDTMPDAALHWDADHAVTGELGPGLVHSRHKQAITDPGSLNVIAAAPDGTVEAVRDPRRPFYLGVQWHPERTDDDRLGQALFDQLIETALKTMLSPRRI